MEKMAQEQLDEFRVLRDNYKNTKSGYGAHGFVPLWKLVAAVDEIDRLMAEIYKRDLLNRDLIGERNDWRDIAESRL